MTYTPPPCRFRLLTVAELLARTEPGYVVQDILPRQSRIMLFGASGAGKSFLALDLALHVAAGATDWFGHPVKAGPVCYVVAEGAGAFHRRVGAWLQAQHLETVERIRFVYDAVQLLDEADTAALAQAILATLPEPALIIFDTYHACTPGSEENSARDTGIIVNNLNLLQRETDAALLLLHHPQKHGEMERGSSALKAAMDVVLKLTADEDGTLTLCSTKVKDGPPLERLTLRLAGFAGSAVVCEPDTEPGATGLRESERQALEALASIALAEGVSCHEWRDSSGLSTATFFRARKRLVDDGLVIVVKQRYRVAGNAVSEQNSQLSRHYHGALNESPATSTITAPPSLKEGERDSEAREVTPKREANARTPRYCRVHTACHLEISPLTGELACRPCTPGLFPELVQQVEDGLVTVTEP